MDIMDLKEIGWEGVD